VHLDDLGWINAFFPEMCEAFFKESADGSENLKVVCYGCIVEQKGHGMAS
jgi:hypothetical protein